MFTQLQVRTGYSLLNSTITTDKYLNDIKQQQLKAAAITDEGVLYGVIPFYKRCIQEGIKPIIGMILHIRHTNELRDRLILLAKNNQGYKQLIHLSTELQLRSADKIDALDIDMLSRYTEGLICIVPIRDSAVCHALENFDFHIAREHYQNISNLFDTDDFYLGIEHYGTRRDEEALQLMSRFVQTNPFQTVAISDVCYVEKEDAFSYDCLQAMKNDETWSLQNANEIMYNRHLRTSAEMQTAFKNWNEPLHEIGQIIEKCNVTFNFEKRMLPSYSVPTGQSASQYLQELCETNLPIRYSEVTSDVKERLQYELRIIDSMQFSDYFLIVWDFITFAKEKGILVGPGRGSAAGSLISYLLGITDIDPLRYNLLFERFLNPDRVSMPDIDIDFSDIRRDEVIDYVREKYGKEHVAQIITFGTYGARSLIRELAKTMQIDDSDTKFILREISKQGQKQVARYVHDSPDLKSYVMQSEKLKTLFRIATKLEGLPRHTSTHAAGVVISEESLTNHVPLTMGSDETYLTQYPMHDLEDIGLLKIDFLGLKNLTFLERVLRSIQYTERVQLDLSQIPLDDLKTFQLLQKGQTNGIFQLESSGMKQVLTELMPTEFADIVAVNALFRPGPMNYIPTYIKRKHGKEPVTYPHPDLEPILEETYGVLVYQEQIMQIAHQIAGFTLGEADLLRRAVGKKQSDVLKSQQEAFMKGCLNNGYDEAIAVEIFNWIVKFANYGFNKSHAVAYSRIAYELAYLKANYPKNFYTEMLNSLHSQQDKRTIYINEAKTHGIQVLPPSINRSLGFYTVDGGHIRMGLQAIKGMNKNIIQEIVDARKKGGRFEHIFDFCTRVDLKVIKRASLETLIRVGAFDEENTNRASLVTTLEAAIDQGILYKEIREEFDRFPSTLDSTYYEIEDFSQVKKLQDEKEFLGVYVSSHPLKTYRSLLTSNGYITMNEMENHLNEYNVKACAIVQSIKEVRTKKGESMAFLTLDDETDEKQAVIFPELYRKVKHWLEVEHIVFMIGKVDERRGELQWLINDMIPFTETELKQETRRLFIKLTEDMNEDQALTLLKNLRETYPGHVPIMVHHEHKKQTYRLQEIYNIEPTKECLQKLRTFFGQEDVVLQG